LGMEIMPQKRGESGRGSKNTKQIGHEGEEKGAENTGEKWIVTEKLCDRITKILSKERGGIVPVGFDPPQQNTGILRVER